MQANIIALDNGEALGRILSDKFETLYSKDNVVRYDGNSKIDVDFMKDDKGKVKIKDGLPVYRQEFMSVWSVERLTTLLYDGRIVLPTDYKFESQINSVVCLKSGTRTRYVCISNTGDHLFSAFKVFAIAQWLCKDFNKTKPVSQVWITGVSSWNMDKKTEA